MAKPLCIVHGGLNLLVSKVFHSPLSAFVINVSSFSHVPMLSYLRPSRLLTITPYPAIYVKYSIRSLQSVLLFDNDSSRYFDGQLHDCSRNVLDLTKQSEPM